MTSNAAARAEVPILEFLRRREVLDPEALDAARRIVAEADDLPERALSRSGIVTERELLQALTEELQLPRLDPNDAPAADPELRRLLPEKLCWGHLVVPIAAGMGTVVIAMASASELPFLEEIQFLTGQAVRPLLAAVSAVEHRIEALFRLEQELTSDAPMFGVEIESKSDEDAEEILRLDVPPPPDENGRIIRLVNQIVEQALRTGASDIHLETFEESCKFRLRIDGVLHEMPPPSKTVMMMILSRFKILAKMDIAEKRVPQDGALSVRTADKRFDLRVNTIPTVYGEKMVMRILDKGAIPLDLGHLGLDPRQAHDLIEAVRMPYGLALVTGPTGSGKSTTLYSCLNLLNEPKVNICTVEDPVEYRFRGMNQVQVKPQISLNFASALRAFLRQDPDIIMVGEVRDQETAEICLRAALTGHFVLSTLHTNDALSAITRLGEMGVEPFLLASTLRVLQAQRLIRKLCAHCKEPYPCEPEIAERYGLRPGETLYRPRGCPQCRRFGYRGRVGIFEVVRITPDLARLIQGRAALPELHEQARQEGFKSLFESALDKVREGTTSLEFALSVTASD